MRKSVISAAVVAAAVAGYGCSDSSGPASANGAQRVGLMVTTLANGVSGAPAVAAPDSVKVGSHTLVLTKVELILREIELKRVAGSADCSFAEPARSGGYRRLSGLAPGGIHKHVRSPSPCSAGRTARSC